MRRDLVRRMVQLEERYRSTEEWPAFVVVCNGIEPERRNRLAANERIVQDWFRNDNQFVLARERITSEAGDEGRRCARNGCLEDLVRELHSACEYRDQGCCKFCAGLGLF